MINDLYQRHKQEKRKRKIMKEKDNNKSNLTYPIPY
jgi:hypothetical protein